MALRKGFSGSRPQSAGSWGDSADTSWTADDDRVDALLGPSHWDLRTITFSFPGSAAEYEDETGEYPTEAGETSRFLNADPSVKTAAFFALSETDGPEADAVFSLEGFTGVNIWYTRAEDATLRYAEGAIDAPAWAYYPGDHEAGGDIWFSRDETWNARAGNYAWSTTIHETGHALGLKHPHEDGTILDAQHDRLEYTVMSYKSYRGATEDHYTNGEWEFPQTWMMLDIAALQELYGADFTPNGREVVYSWRPGSGDTRVNGKVAIDAGSDTIFATIWDGGGNVTYDLSAFRNDLVISLEPGAFSVFSKSQLATVREGSSPLLAQGNIYNGLLHDDDPRSLVRKAIGGTGNDRIEGNAAANVLDGGGGSDRLTGKDGDDILMGRAGNDVLTGGRGSDTARFVTAGDVTADLALSGAQRTGEGRDTLAGIENLWGGTGMNRLWGDGAANRLRGAEKADLLNGRGGDDTLEGRGGNDRLYGKEGNDRLTGGAGNDLISGGTGTDTAIFGGSVGVTVDLRITGAQLTGQGRDRLIGIENLEGGNGFDRLTGNDGANRLSGGRGSDVLTGNGGNDRLAGGAGADSFVFVGAIGRDVIEDFSQTEDDLITLSADLWADAGELDAAGVVDSFAFVEEAGVVLRFAPDAAITLNGLSSVSGLADHLLIV